MIGRHKTSKKPNDPTYSAQWSGVSFAPHSDKVCEDCGTRLHNEGDSLYCPYCDDYKKGR